MPFIRNIKKVCSLFFIFFYSFTIFGIDLKISKAEEKSLNQFFHALLWGSQVGYVLYGDKPICFEGYSEDISTNPFTIGYHLGISLNEGVKIWKKLQLPFYSSKFLFINQQIENDLSLVLFINREAVKQVFNKNAAIFRYILGPEVTAGKLIEEFKRNNFFTVLKDDNVLIGLLLGFGFESSLHIGRFEHLSEDLYSYKILNKSPYHSIFFKSKKVIPPLKNFSLQPSFGYSSLQQEWEALFSNIKFASESLETYSPKLTFGRMKNCIRDEELIKDYEKTQLKIIEILDHPNWLEHVLSQFYNEPVNIDITDFMTNKTQVVPDLNWPKIVAQTFFYKFSKEFEDRDSKKLQEFIAGMEEAKKKLDAHYLAPFPLNLEDHYPYQGRAFLMGFKVWSFYKFNNGLFPLNSVTKELLNNSEGETDFFPLLTTMLDIEWQIFQNINNYEISLALSHFQNIEKDKHSKVRCLAKNCLYYQQINSGNGSLIIKDQIVKVSYTLKTFYDNIIQKEENSFLDLRRTIKAFRQSFPNMRVGEKGILYIHPEWGLKEYFTPPYYSPYLIAEFEILSLL